MTEQIDDYPAAPERRGRAAILIIGTTAVIAVIIAATSSSSPDTTSRTPTTNRRASSKPWIKWDCSTPARAGHRSVELRLSIRLSAGTSS
jgi:hypothetical protein